MSVAVGRPGLFIELLRWAHSSYHWWLLRLVEHRRRAWLAGVLNKTGALHEVATTSELKFFSRPCPSLPHIK